MRLLRTTLLSAVAAAVGATSALAGGGGGPPVYPAVVNVQLLRTAKQLEEATKFQDAGDGPHPVASLTSARSPLHRPWLAAKYVIDNAPPPVAGDGALSRPVPVAKAKVAKRAAKPAHASGGAVGGVSPY